MATIVAVKQGAERVLEPARRALGHRVAGPILKVVLAYVFLVEGVLQWWFGRIDIPFVKIGWIELSRAGHAPIPRVVFLAGAVMGCLYALVGVGLILVYRANRIVNFAQAQLGSVAAVLALLLIAKRGWPYLSVIPIVIVGAALLGGIVEVTLVRRFAAAPRLILTAATIGIGLLLAVLEFFTKQWVGGNLLDVTAFSYRTPFDRFSWQIGVGHLSGNHIAAVVIVAAIVVALGAFFKFTDMGIAVRASAENGERATLLGIPVKRVSTVVWVLAAVLSGVGVFLRGPLVGINLDSNVGPSVLIYGLAVAVLARMESMPTAFFAGMLVGIVDRTTVFAVNRAGLSFTSLFVLIVIGLLLQRGTVTRAVELGASSWQLVKEFRPIPTELRSLREVTVVRYGGGGVLLAIVLAAPFILGAKQAPSASLMVIYAIIGISLVVLTGWAGQISLGQYAIAGVGSAVTAGLAANHGWDFFGAIFVGALAGAVIAVVIGLPALRIQGLFLAITTLAFAFVVSSMLNREYFAWLLPKSGRPASRPNIFSRIDLERDSKLGPVSIGRDAKYYWVCLAFLMLTIALARSLRRNRSGRVFIGVRDNGRLMQAFGVSLSRTRLAAFALSGFLAGMAGGLLAYQNRFIADNAFQPESSIAIFVMAVIGGVGSISGALLGAVFVVGLPLLPGLRDIDQIQLLTSGLGVLVVLLFLPGGLAEGCYRVRDRWLRALAAKHSIHVPSLVADSRVEEEEKQAAAHAIEAAGATVELVEAAAAHSLIRCPICGLQLPADVAGEHEHLRVTADDLRELEGVVPSGGNGSHPVGAKGVDR